MKISLKGLSDQQKEQVKTIVTLGQTIGGNEKMDNYLMQQLMGVYMPEVDKVGELASLYGITEDEQVKKDLLKEYYNSRGMEYSGDSASSPDSVAQQALLEKFKRSYSTDIGNDKKAYENAQFQSAVTQNPEILDQYYSYEQPDRTVGEAWSSNKGLLKSPMSFLSQLGGGETSKQKRARLQKLIEQYKSNIPRN